MSYTDGKAAGNAVASGRGPTLRPEMLGEITLAGTLTLTNQYRDVLRLDPDGSNRDVVLPAEAESTGRYFRFINFAGGAENLVVKDDGGNTICTINQNEQGEVWCDGTAWKLLCITTIALS